MKAINNFLQEGIDISKLKISDQDVGQMSYERRKELGKSTSIKNPNSKWFLITHQNKPVAIAGCVIVPNRDNKVGFWQVYIENEYRGKDLLCPIAKLVFKKLKLELMISTIRPENTASLKSHAKSKCFIPITNKEADIIKQYKIRKATNDRYIFNSNWKK